MHAKIVTEAEQDKFSAPEQPAMYESPCIVYEAPMLVRNILLGIAKEAVYTETNVHPNPG